MNFYKVDSESSLKYQKNYPYKFFLPLSFIDYIKKYTCNKTT